MLRRIIDILFALTWLTLISPIMLVVAILIKLESHGPILYRPKMVGWNGRIFFLLRFRTMDSDPAHTDNHFTRVGSFIRNYSLDHLPQLINLLRGDITLIGPRPMEVDTVDLRDAVWKKYVQARPGLFNYAVYKLGKQWTPSRSSHPTLNQELELRYMKQRSVSFDVQLLLDSLRMLVSSKGNIKARGDVAPELEERIKDNR